MHMDRNESSFVFAKDSLVLWRKVYNVFCYYISLNIYPHK